MPLHIFKNPNTGKKNVIARNLCIIQGTIPDGTMVKCKQEQDIIPIR